jgi:hypothetical protein
LRQQTLEFISIGKLFLDWSFLTARFGNDTARHVLARLQNYSTKRHKLSLDKHKGTKKGALAAANTPFPWIAAQDARRI